MKRSVHGETGVALIAALFAVVILFGLAVVFVATATFESRSTAGARDAEIAIHVAEGAVDDLIPRVNASPDDHVTVRADGTTPHAVPTDATPAEERALLLEYAQEADPDELGNGPRLVQFGSGEGFAIRPVDENDEPRNVLYAVGWVPNRDAPTRTRVVKLRFDTLRFNPNVGLLSGGDLTFGGNAGIQGTHGSVHANGDAAAQPGSFGVTGDLTATGSIQESALCDKVDGECYGGAQPRPVPHIDAETMYGLHGQHSAPWFDLCPPGQPDPSPTVREHSPGGPCTGDEVEWDAGSESFRGWRYQNGQWRAGHAHDGVYYVYRSNAAIHGTVGSGPRSVTVVAEGAPPGTDAGNASGHIVTTGNPEMSSALSGMTLVADRDVVMGGTVTVEGLVGAHEQIDIPGTVHITGAVVAEDATDTAGSMVSKTRVTGNITIDYDGTLEVPLAGVIRITAWNEL